MIQLGRQKRTLLLGNGVLVRELMNEISRRPRCRYSVVGVIVRDAQDNIAPDVSSAGGTAEELHRLVHEKKPDVILVACAADQKGLLDHQLLAAAMFMGIRIEHAKDVYERLAGKLAIEAYRPDEFVYSGTFRPSQTTVAVNRLMSLAIAIWGIILFAPLFLLIAGLIKLDSPGPVLFVQQRSGVAGKPFTLLKFRTMTPCLRAASEWEIDNTARITRVGRWLRKFRLDELPQFFNVLRGDMNIVGPRPHPSSNYELMALASRNIPESGVEIPYYYLRSSVRPGITGWAQVRYRYANNLEEEIEKLRFDLYYIKHCSVWLDIRILLETIKTVVAGKEEAKIQLANRSNKAVPEERASGYVGS